MHDLRLPSETFWYLTPVELGALIRRREQQEELKDSSRQLFLAEIKATVYTATGVKRDKNDTQGWHVKDFMPKKWREEYERLEKEEASKKPATDFQSMLNVAKQLNTLYGGTVKKGKKKIPGRSIKGL